MKGCVVRDCARPHSALGLCRAHYLRIKRGKSLSEPIVKQTLHWRQVRAQPPRCGTTFGVLRGELMAVDAVRPGRVVYDALLMGVAREDIADDYELDLADVDAAHDYERALRGES